MVSDGPMQKLPEQRATDLLPGIVDHARSLKLFCENSYLPATGRPKQTTTGVGEDIATADLVRDSSNGQPAGSSDHASLADIVQLQQLGLSNVIALMVEQPRAANKTAVVAEHSDEVIGVEPTIQPAVFYGSRKRKPTAPYSPSEDVSEKRKQARRPRSNKK